MRVVVKPLPVLYACQGCPEYGQAARDAGAQLDRKGVAQMIWLGANDDTRPSQRYPIVALDGCQRACALRWLKERGVAAEASYILR